MFSLHCRPNKQNERYWANEDPLVEDECRVQGGPKAMAWAMIVNGTVSVYWFDPGVRLNADSYIEMLQSFMMPRLEEMPGNELFWYQQDGAPAPLTLLANRLSGSATSSGRASSPGSPTSPGPPTVRTWH